ncbi:hypothetical protein SAMN05216285_0867 [Natrinema salifodinae]|uniref:Uncharacterized protein n=1 Tax=Natrinema salifodinae TaxID=1202768 RepID=A0A1I0MFM0_9EURY|nr:hypothetical protein SAMN05216285_0867 [Natrinema salifodinae]
MESGKCTQQNNCTQQDSDRHFIADRSEFNHNPWDKDTCNNNRTDTEDTRR